MRTRKEIEENILLPDVTRELLLDIRQIAANILMNQRANEKEIINDQNVMAFVLDCKRIAEEPLDENRTKVPA